MHPGSDPSIRAPRFPHPSTLRDSPPALVTQCVTKAEGELVGNGSRVWFNRRELDCRIVGWFALGAVPTALAGGLLFARAPLAFLTRLLGAFLLVVIVFLLLIEAVMTLAGLLFLVRGH